MQCDNTNLLTSLNDQKMILSVSKLLQILTTSATAQTSNPKILIYKPSLLSTPFLLWSLSSVLQIFKWLLSINTIKILSHAVILYWKTVSRDGIYSSHSRPKHVCSKVSCKASSPVTGWPTDSVPGKRRTKRNSPLPQEKRHFVLENN